MADALKTVFLLAVFLLWTLICLPPGLLLVLACGISRSTALERLMRRANWLYGHLLIRFVSPVLKVEVRRAEGETGSFTPGPAIVVLNHQSLLDIFLVGALPFPESCLVSKSWPWKIAFYAPMMRMAGFINIDSMEADELLETCRKRLEENAALVMFPEGQRTRDGRLQRFHVGAFALAMAIKQNITPVVIHDSWNVLKTHSRRLRPGTIHMEILPEIRYEDFVRDALPHRAMMRQAHTSIENALNKRKGI